MLLDYYLLKQLIVLFGLTVGLLSGVGVAIGTLSELAYQINNYNLPLLIALKIFCLKIPEYVAYGLPIATLLTTLIVYGKLNGDRELIALRSVGISVYRIVLPAMLFSFLISVITLITNEAIVPQANYQVSLLQQPFIPENKLTLQRKDIFYSEYEISIQGEKKLKRLYYAEDFDGRKLNNLVILNWSKLLRSDTELKNRLNSLEGKVTISKTLNQIITAKSAFWNSQLNSWRLQEGIIDNLANNTANTNRMTFNNYNLKLPKTFFQLVNQERDLYSMSLVQAKDYLKLILNSNNLNKIRLFKVRIQQKIAFPSICLIFALIGSSIGTTFTNLNRSQSFGFCVAIVFVYYLLAFLIGSLGIVGIISPLIAAWLPNIIGFGFGFWLLKQAN